MHGNIQLNVGKEWELMILHFGLQSEAYLMVGLLNWSDLDIRNMVCISCDGPTNKEVQT